jgi:RNA polymerase sigma-B factor
VRQVSGSARRRALVQASGCHGQDHELEEPLAGGARRPPGPPIGVDPIPGDQPLVQRTAHGVLGARAGQLFEGSAPPQDPALLDHGERFSDLEQQLDGSLRGEEVVARRSQLELGAAGEVQRALVARRFVGAGRVDHRRAIPTVRRRDARRGTGGGEDGTDAPLELVCDRLEAMLTIPSKCTCRRFWTRTGSPVPVTDESVWLDQVRFHRTRSPEVRGRLVTEHLGYARHLASRYARSVELQEDLEQVAIEALVVALDRFEPARGTPFLGYAGPVISGALKRFYRDSGWALRVPRRVHEMARPINQAARLLEQDLGRQPTEAEIADLLGVDVREVTDTLVAAAARDGRSLDLEIAQQGEPGSIDPAFVRIEDRATVQQAVRALSDASREVLGLYYEDGLSQVVIAERLGISQMQVSRMLAKAIAQLRSHVPTSTS